MYADLLPAEAEAWHLKCLGGQKMPSLEPLHPARGGDRVTLTLKPTPRKFYKAPDLDKSTQCGLSTANPSTATRGAPSRLFDHFRPAKYGQWPDDRTTRRGRAAPYRCASS